MTSIINKQYHGPMKKQKRKKILAGAGSKKVPKRDPIWVLEDLDMVQAPLDPTKGLPLDHRNRPVSPNPEQNLRQTMVVCQNTHVPPLKKLASVPHALRCRGSVSPTCLAEQRVQTYQDERKSSTEKREIIQIKTDHARINDDPKFDVTAPEGKRLQALWKGNVVVTDAPQGSGKTYWMNRAIVNQLRDFPKKRIVFLCPFTSLTTAVVTRLQAALAEAVREHRIPPDHGFVVHQYQEDTHQDWNVLVIHPRSLRKYSFEGVDKIVMDEACAVLRQTGCWGNPDEETKLSINGGTDILRKLVAQSDWLMMSCAQMTDQDREMLFTLLGVTPDVKVIQYSNIGLGPFTPVVDVACPNVLRSLIWEDVLAGQRVVVSVRHAKDVDKLNSWLGKMVAQHNRDTQNASNRPKRLSVPSVPWTAAWRDSRNDSPARNVTQWLTSHSIQVLFYTNGLSPGMSIDHELGYWHRVYMYISNRGGGADCRVLAQLARRVRQPQDRTVRMYVEKVYTAVVPSADTATLSKRAVAAVLAENRDERQLDLDEHCRVVDVLKPGASNNVRLQLMYEKLEAPSVIQTVDVVEYMGNAAIVSTDTRRMKPSPCWTEVLAEEKQAAAVKTLHLGDDELPDIRRWAKFPFPEENQRTLRYNHIANTLPPEFVKAGYRRIHSLTSAAFAAIDDKYQQLLVVQELARLDVQALLENIDLYAHAEELSGETGTYNVDPVRRAVATICAVIAMITSTGVDTSAITGGLGMNMTVTVAASVVVAASPEGSSSSSSRNNAAYDWVTENWKMIRTLPSRNFQLPVVIPHQTNTEQWTVCLQRILKEHTGLSWRQRKNGAQFELTQLSMWSKLSIEVEKYVAWYRSPHASQFGIIQKSIQCCTECDGVGDDIRCLRQNNAWRCISRQTSDARPHRQPFEPLDVHAAWQVERKEEEEGKEEKQEQEQQKQFGQETPIDRLVGHLAFKGGATVGGSGVSTRELKRSWSTANVSQEDIETIFVLYGVDLKAALAHRADTKKLLIQVNTILRTLGIQLRIRKHRVEGKQHRKYYLMSLNK
jgi:hypothetical protein